jgi:hypothetical protein
MSTTTTKIPSQKIFMAESSELPRAVLLSLTKCITESSEMVSSHIANGCKMNHELYVGIIVKNSKNLMIFDSWIGTTIQKSFLSSSCQQLIAKILTADIAGSIIPPLY